MLEKCLFILLLCFLDVRSDILCEVGFCSNYLLEEGCPSTAVECSINNATHMGLSLPSSTMCNCCDYCLPLYGDGAPCSVGGPGTGTTVGRCGDGLTCKSGTDGNYCERMTTDCHNAQDLYDERRLRGELGALEIRPVCDGKGKYAGFDCVPTQTCFCQSEEGERIFGETLYVGAAQDMPCGCSRFHEKIKKNISPGVPHPVVGPRCTADGNFHPVQCMARTCYCVNTVTGEIRDVPSVNLDRTPLTELQCYDPDLDFYPNQSEGEPPYNYTTPCLEEMALTIDLIQESEDAGYIMDYFNSITDCLIDGSFGRTSVNRDGVKICVDEHSQRIGDYEALPNTPEFTSMNCKCAVSSQIMGTSNELPVCCKNGNFRPIQCRRGQCRCVDDNGRQTQKESPDVTSLSCYNADWKSC